MKILNIMHDSIVDGIGLRAVIFFAGCPHKCKGCHNSQSWNIDYGSDYTISQIIDNIKSNTMTKGVTLSGGDPMFQASEVKVLACRLKKMGYNLWIYSGYTYEEILDSQSRDMIELLKCCDVLVDGRFEEDKKDLTLAMRGSSNQLIIDLNESFKQDEKVLLDI